MSFRIIGTGSGTTAAGNDSRIVNAIQSTQVVNSVTFSGGALQLVNDQLSPSGGTFYGFQGGVKGWYNISGSSIATASYAYSSSNALQSQNSATASYAFSASNALQAQSAVTASIATSASYVSFANIDRNSLPQLLSQSNAITASSLLVTGTTVLGPTTGSSLYLTGGITALSYNIEFVSSSVIYSSGSTKFGDSYDDVQQFTGSTQISGSLTVVGPANLTSSLSITSSYALSSSNALQAQSAVTASFASFGIAPIQANSLVNLAYINSITSSFATQGNYVVTASGANNNLTASFAFVSSQSFSSSYASSASVSLTSVSSSYSVSSSNAIQAQSASFAFDIRNFINIISSSYSASINDSLIVVSGSSVVNITLPLIASTPLSKQYNIKSILNINGTCSVSASASDIIYEQQESNNFLVQRLEDVTLVNIGLGWIAI